jgi:hypothetical protein
MVMGYAVPRSRLWVGEGSIYMPPVEGEELDDLKPIRVGRGFRYGLSCSVTDLRILKDLR